MKRISLRGKHAISMDAKGRMAIPARYRTVLSEWCHSELVATVDSDERCVLIYPAPVWDELEEKLQSLPSMQKSVRRIQRLLIGYASDLEMDSNGRVLLPSSLRDYAGLDKKLVLMGQGKKFELWDEARWNEKEAELLNESVDLETLPEELKMLSI